MKKALLTLGAVCLQTITLNTKAISAETHQAEIACENLIGKTGTRVFELSNSVGNRLDIGKLSQETTMAIVNDKDHQKYLGTAAEPVEVSEAANECIVLVRSSETAEQVTLQYSFNQLRGCDEWESTGQAEGWRGVELPDLINHDHEPHYTAGYNFLNKKVCITPKEVTREKDLVLDFKNAKQLEEGMTETYILNISQSVPTEHSLSFEAKFISNDDSDNTEYKISHGKPVWNGLRDKLKFKVR